MSKKLEALAKDINKESALMTKDLESAMERATRIGGWLNEAKALCAHGQWLTWVAENCPFQIQRANKFMRVQLGLNYSPTSNFDSVDEAYSHFTAQDNIERSRKQAEKNAVEKAKVVEKKVEQKRVDAVVESVIGKAPTKKEMDEESRKRRSELLDMLDIFMGRDKTDQLTEIIKEFDSPEMNKAIFKVMKQHMHPDKSGNEILFKKLAIIEESLK